MRKDNSVLFGLADYFFLKPFGSELQIRRGSKRLEARM